VWKTKEEENFTGLLTATPPSIMLNSLVTGGSAFVSCKVNCTGGKYVGAADVAPHTSFTGTLSRTSCLAFHEEKKTGCWILMSKDGMMTEVRAPARYGSLPKYSFSSVSSPLALYLGPFSAAMFFLNWPNGPLQKPKITTERISEIALEPRILRLLDIKPKKLHKISKFFCTTKLIHTTQSNSSA
jgi:hypothetical protein